jgi:hypothetical protein
MNPFGVASDKGQVPGVLVRGQDGKLYFIPENKLAPFAVPEKGVPQMSSKIAGDQPATHTAVPTEWVNVGVCLIQHA